MPEKILVEEPFPIYTVAGRYLLYDVNVVSRIRATYHMCGCLTGTLPQIPQQNVFLGLPLQLMTEEAALLVEKGVAYIVDDVQTHKQSLKSMLEADKAAYLAQRAKECEGDALAHRQDADERRSAYIKQKKGSSKTKTEYETSNNEEMPGTEDKNDVTETSLFAAAGDHQPSASSEPAVNKNGKSPLPLPASALQFYPIASTSHPAYHKLKPATPTSTTLVPRPRPSSFALYKHLQGLGFYLSPGLRFGCQFMAYPGDPLRFHSHFVANGLEWDEEIPILDIVGGGRLGTGVKKAWMMGGEDPQGDVRVFCVEWGGF